MRLAKRSGKVVAMHRPRALVAQRSRLDTLILRCLQGKTKAGSCEKMPQGRILATVAGALKLWFYTARR